MLRLYRSIIRSKLEYGCFVYSTAKEKVLDLLSPIHNAALRLCTGAFRSSPVLSLYAETGEPPLSFRRKQLLLQFYIRTQQLPNSLTSWHINQRINQATAHSLTIGNQVEHVLSEVGGVELLVAPFRYSAAARWKLPPDLICDGFECPRKSDAPPNVLRGLFLRHLHDVHENQLRIFTDGSKDDRDVGCSAVSDTLTRTMKLAPLASVYTAELYGFKLALQMASTLQYNNYSIFTDSLAVLNSMSHYNSTNPVITSIHNLILELNSNNKTVKLCWCPAHVGVQMNEGADRAAGLAAHSDGPILDMAVPYKDLYANVRSLMRSEWSNIWQQQVHNKLHIIKDNVIPSPHLDHKNRMQSRIITRLRIGHTHTAYTPGSDGA